MGTGRNPVDTATTSQSFLARHEFLIRRLHSLSGLIPVGAFMIVHLTVNASVLNSPGTFQRSVYQIHSLGKILPLVEWAFIFAPILFHGIFGVVIIRGGLSNAGRYPYTNNIRYTLQRATGVIALLFILWHVFHMHGWFHFDAWLQNVVEPLGGAQFKPFSAASTATLAMQGFLVPFLYAIGLIACVYHLANGLWTMGITWGIWTSPAAQQRANLVCSVFGVGLLALSMSALYGMVTVDADAAVKVEDAMYQARTESGEIEANPDKRSHGDESNSNAVASGRLSP
jgi:succinate dehydrogenase / fumarate reductase cytochrome b subunit